MMASTARTKKKDQTAGLLPGAILILEEAPSPRRNLGRVATGGPSGPRRAVPSERDLRRLGDRLAVELEKRGVLGVAEHPGKDDGREALLVGVVGRGRVVERLAENATLFSVEVSSSLSCIMFWLALRSG